MLRRLVTPWRAWDAWRSQLGSLRSLHLGPERLIKRADMGKHQQVVLLVHGYFQTRNLWEVMEDRLRFDGYAVVSFHQGGLGSRFSSQPVEVLARFLHDKVEVLAERHGLEQLHVVAHSRGGLGARRYVEELGGHRRVLSLTTLGTPHHLRPAAAVAGAVERLPLLEGLGLDQTADRLVSDRFPTEVPLVSIYSADDLVVPWWSSVVRPHRPGAPVRSVEVRGVGHSQLAWDPMVYKAVRQALEEAG